MQHTLQWLSKNNNLVSFGKKKQRNASYYNKQADHDDPILLTWANKFAYSPMFTALRFLYKFYIKRNMMVLYFW